MAGRASLVAIVAALFVAALAPAGTSGLPAHRVDKAPGRGALDKSPSDIKDEGVGMYTDASVANQASSFAVNREIVSCGVGTLANGNFSGPFAMLMYATRIKSYRVDRNDSTIKVTGTMRSITEVGGTTMEDVEHEFLAVAVDAGASGTDRFDVHFTTPFWDGGNPMCTPSDLVTGGCRFGGQLLMGDIAVGR